VCQALLEHVSDVNGAFESIASILRPGGQAVIFVRSRNAVFARINLVLPEKFKRWILFQVFPQAIGDGGIS
jgi:SAM-dependent methyltransferase